MKILLTPANVVGSTKNLQLSLSVVQLTENLAVWAYSCIAFRKHYKS
jgi:hypothetical protein